MNRSLVVQACPARRARCRCPLPAKVTPRSRASRRATGLLLCWLLLSGSAFAQPAYRFQVVELELQVTALPNASARWEYEIVFQNEPGAHAIDIVDVGLPHPRYQLWSMRASIDGVPVHAIRQSSYIDVGVEVDLGAHAIPPGGRGEFRFSCEMPDLVYQDTTDKAYASLQVRPLWFDPQLQTGTTALRIAIHAPPGVKAAELRYQDDKQAYSQLVDNFGTGDDAHAVAIWESPTFQLTARNPKFSVSFPKRTMDRVVSKSAWQLLVEWFAGNPKLQWWSGISLLVLLAFAFFRFSHGTGFVVYALLAGFLGYTMVVSPAGHLLTWPLMLAAVPLNEWNLRRRRKKGTYLPAMATVEGGGIKRGLTAPQAAVVLEMPLPRVIAMVLFGLLKKQVVRLTQPNPCAVEVDAPWKTTRDLRLQVAAQRGIVLHDYEHPFLDRLMMHDGPVETCNLNEATGALIQSVVERMQGFDLSATREYYTRIVKRAWKEAESVGEVKQRDDVIERNFEWMMMEPDWTDVFADWHRRGYDYRPQWTRIPSRGGSTGGTPTSTRPSSPTSSIPTFGEVAGSFAGWAEATAGRLAGMVDPLAMGLDVPSGRGIIDLSGVDRVTGDVFEALAKSAASSGSRRGGGGGCACACAGCACACACAGGGR